jgi:hypothetical protein
VSDSLGHLAEREGELVDQDGVGPSFFDWREVLTRNVLNEREQERIAIVAFPDESGNRREPGRPRCAPPPLTGDELPLARPRRTNDHGLNEALCANRLRELGDPLGVEPPPRLP